MGNVRGLSFLIIGTFVEIAANGLPLTLASVWTVQRSQPLLWIIDTAPLILGFIATNLGSQRSLASMNELDADALSSVIGAHESGLHFIAAPTFPSDAETLRGETLGMALNIARAQYEYVVADLPHDFSEFAIHALDVADVILVVASPDMASVRAVTAAMDTYEKLGYSKDKIKFVLSAPFPHSSLTKEKIEAALEMSALATIPYVQDVLVDAINLGQQPVYHRPNESISALLEDFAFRLSKDTHKKNKPEDPTDPWKRVYKRYQTRKK